MKIFWVKAGKILPVDTGGRIRSYHLLRALAEIEELTFLSYYGGPRDEEYEAAIQKELPGAITVCTAASDATAFEQGFLYLRCLPGNAPFAVSKFTNSKVRGVVEEQYDKKAFDVAICDFLSASLNFPEVLSRPTALFQHNVESCLWERLADRESNLVKKLFYRVESAKMARYERKAIARFHHVIAVSEVDRQQMLAMKSDCPITVVPTGVNCREYPVAPASQSRPPRIVFIGSMDWEPNIDAVAFFCREIWPIVLAEFPDSVFEVVGRNPHASVRRLASQNVKVTGTVPSVRDYVDPASVVVVPLRIGGGTRLKIFEAMAMGKALVSTTIGAEGLDVTSGRDVILADDPRSFADSILLLLRDDALRRRYEIAAAQLASQYDWSEIAKRFRDALEQTVSDTSRNSSAADPLPA